VIAIASGLITGKILHLFGHRECLTWIRRNSELRTKSRK
jgi:hypothetical protein